MSTLCPQHGTQQHARTVQCRSAHSTWQTTALDFCQHPCSPQRGYPPRKQSIPQGQSEGCRVLGYIHLQSIPAGGWRLLGTLMPHLKQTSVLLPSLGPAGVTVHFSPCSLQLWSLRQFALLCLWSSHGRVPLPAVCHGATLWKMRRTYSVLVITSACGFRSLVSHLPPFHFQKSKQLVKIQNNLTPVCSHFALTHLILFHCLQTFVQSDYSRRSTPRKKRRCKIMSSGHLCCLQSNLLAQMCKYLALLAVAEHLCNLVREEISHGQTQAAAQ